MSLKIKFIFPYRFSKFIDPFIYSLWQFYTVNSTLLSYFFLLLQLLTYFIAQVAYFLAIRFIVIVFSSELIDHLSLIYKLSIMRLVYA